MSHDVFISYATEDKTIADAVCFGLEKEGIRCWIAPRDILPSENYDDAIVHAINNARAMVVIFSSKIFRSQFVKSEIERGFSKGLIIAPFRIEDVAPEGGLELYLGRRHWLDAMTPPLENHIHKLATTIQAMLAAPVVVKAPIPAPTPPVVPPAPSPSPQPVPAPAAYPKMTYPPLAPQKPGLLANRNIRVGLVVGALAVLVLIVALIGAPKGGGNPASTQPPTAVANLPKPTESGGGMPAPTDAVIQNPPTEAVNPPSMPVQNTSVPAAPAAFPGSWLNLADLPRNINDFEVDPANPRVVYAATGDYTGAGGGMYKSEDAGLTWTSVKNNLPSQTVLAVTVVQGPAPIVLAGLDGGGAFSSTDGGATWTDLGKTFSGGGQHIVSFALSGDRKTVFAVVEYLGIARSDNGGQSWTPLGEGLPKQDNQTLVQSVTVDPTDAKILYVGTGGFVGGGAGVYKSTDGGDTWAASNKGMLDYYITAVAVDPANNQVVYAGGGSGDFFKSSDGGKTWTNLTDRLKLVQYREPREIRSIQIDPVTGLVYLLADNSGLIYSADKGEKWRMVGIPPGTDQPQFTSLGVIFGDKPVFLMSIPGVTTASGWRYGEGQAASGAVPAQPTAAITPARALNLSGTWQTIADLPRNVSMLAVDPANPNQVFAGISDPGGRGGLFKSEDGGLTWAAAGGPNGKGVMAMAFAAGSTPTLYATSGSGGEVYTSQDGAKTWVLAGKSLTSPFVDCHLVAAPSDGKILYFVGDPGLSRSDDGGKTWQPAGDGLPNENQTPLVLSIAIDPSNAKIVYVGTGGFVGQGQGVFKSVDGGFTWAPANKGMLDYRITAVTVDPHQPLVVYAGSQNGDLFKSSDGGQTWANLVDKLKIVQYQEPREIRSLQIDPGTGILYLAGDNSGVLYSSSGGEKWRMVGNPSSFNQPYQLKFATTFGEKPVIFLSAENGGVWRWAPNP